MPNKQVSRFLNAKFPTCFADRREKAAANNVLMIKVECNKNTRVVN